MCPVGMSTANEIIDFELERGRHGTLLGRDRYLREYNVQVIPYSDYAALPGILEALRGAGSQSP